jgi:hypothetical protein
LVLGSWWRRSAAALLLVGLVAGVTGGVVAGLLCGASRTRSAYDRFVALSRIPDVYVDSPDGNPADAETIRRVPGVKGVAMISMGGVQVAGSKLYLQIGESLDGGYGREVNTTRIVAGRAARVGADNEVVLSEPIAAALHKSVGGRLQLESYTPAQIDALKRSGDGAPEGPKGPTATMTVVGIQRTPTNVVTDKILSDQIILPAGFSRRYGEKIGAWGHAIFVDVGPSPSAGHVATVARRIRALPGFEDRLVDAAPRGSQPTIQPTLDFVATGLTVLAAAVAFTGLATVGFLLTRIITGFSSEASLLGTLGANRAARRRALALIAAPAAVASPFALVCAAVATTAVIPFGLAARADPTPGLRFDAAAIGLSAVAVAFVLMLIADLCAWRAVNTTMRPLRTRRLGARLRPVEWPAAFVGLSFAFDRGGGRRRSGGRIAVSGLATAAAALVATFVFVASTTYLLETPKAYGWTWDLQVNADRLSRIAAEHGVASASEVRLASVSIDGAAGSVRGIRTVSGTPPLRLLRGRPVNGPDEVVLGGRSMAILGVDLGARVILGDNEHRHSFRVVGEAVFAGIDDVPSAASGAAIRLDQLVELTKGTNDEGFTTGLIELEPGVDRNAFVKRVAKIPGAHPEVISPTPGADIERLGDADSLPWILVAFLATVGVLSLASSAISVVGRRRHDLGVLRAMGFTRANVRTSVMVQAVALTLTGLAIGIPAGLILGRYVWRWFATDLDVAVDIITPWPLITALAVASLTVFAVFSLVPARTASRVRAADVLRAE